MIEMGAAAVAVGNGLSSVWSFFRSSGTGKSNDIHYDPFLTLYELAMISLMSSSENSMIKLNFGQYCLDRQQYDLRSRMWRTAGTWSGLNPQSRLTTESIIHVAVRAIRQYSVEDKNERSPKIRFLFEKAIAGLAICKETYIKSYGSKYTSRIAVDNFSKAQTILRNTLEGKEQSEEVRKLMDQQEAGVEVTSRNFWILTGSGTEVDLITTRVEHLEQVYALKEDDSRIAAFLREKESVEANLTRDKTSYVNSLTTK